MWFFSYKVSNLSRNCKSTMFTCCISTIPLSLKHRVFLRKCCCQCNRSKLRAMKHHQTIRRLRKGLIDFIHVTSISIVKIILIHYSTHSSARYQYRIWQYRQQTIFSFNLFFMWITNQKCFWFNECSTIQNNFWILLQYIRYLLPQ